MSVVADRVNRVVPYAWQAAHVACLFVHIPWRRLKNLVYAIGGNPEAARLAGVNVKWTLLRVYLIMGACAGLAGVIFAARVESGQPKAGEGYELDAIAAVVLGGTSLFGGRGRITGTLIGALIIGVLSNGLVLMDVPFFFQLVVKGAVIIFAIAIDGLKNLKRT
jgi:ribose transport system permease protein